MISVNCLKIFLNTDPRIGRFRAFKGSFISSPSGFLVRVFFKRAFFLRDIYSKVEGGNLFFFFFFFFSSQNLKYRSGVRTLEDAAKWFELHKVKSKLAKELRRKKVKERICR